MRFILCVWLRPSAYVDEEEVPFVLSVFTSIKQRVCLNVHALQERVLPGQSHLIFGAAYGVPPHVEL
jgi:hypothetical protein